MGQRGEGLRHQGGVTATNARHPGRSARRSSALLFALPSPGLSRPESFRIRCSRVHRPSSSTSSDVDVLDDVAGLRIDRDRAARAFPFHPFHGADKPIAIGRAAGLPQRLIEDMHSVVAADREEVCPHAIVCFPNAIHEGPILLGRMRRRVEVGGHRAEHDVAHIVQGIVVGEVAGSEQPDPRLVEPALDRTASSARPPDRQGRIRRDHPASRRAPAAGTARNPGSAAGFAALRRLARPPG